LTRRYSGTVLLVVGGGVATDGPIHYFLERKDIKESGLTSRLRENLFEVFPENLNGYPEIYIWNISNIAIFIIRATFSG